MIEIYIMRQEKLIFLISQPRSGSSLIQHLLMGSDKINSVPEPWQMLALVSTYKNFDVMQGFNQRFTSINFKRYLNTIPNGYLNYLEEVKCLSLKMYGERAKNSEFFLDKTPRYYHIIPELYQLFPRAKYIFLVRNPLAVFSSILDYNFKGDVYEFLASNDRLDDLLLAPQNIFTSSINTDNSLIIRYEDVIENSEEVISKVFKYLGINQTPVKSYSITNEFKKSTSIDTKSLHRHDMPVKDYLYSWKSVINSTQKKRAALDYLDKLNSQFEDYFGYDLVNIRNELSIHKPKTRSSFNLSFDLLSTPEFELSFKNLMKKRLYKKLNHNF